MKAARICPGYRDELTLLFRDQSEQVKKKRSVPQTAPKTTTPRRASPALTPTPPEEIIHILPPLAQDPEEQGVCYFYNSYVTQNSITFPDGYFNYLPEIMLDKPIDSPLPLLIASLGMAFIANQHDDQALLCRAMSKYALTLKLMKVMLRDPVAQLSDEALICVHLMGIYEASTCQNNSIMAWTNHVEGAAALIKLRGSEQLDRSMGRRLFTQLRAQILITCIAKRIRVPEEILKWNRHVGDSESGLMLHVATLSDISCRFANMRAERDSIGKFLISAESLVACLALDAELDAFAAKFQIHYPFCVVYPEEESDLLLRGSYYLYPNSWVGVVWNSYRSIRLLTNEMIYDQAGFRMQQVLAQSELGPGVNTYYLGLRRTAKDRIIGLADDVCATVPFFFGYHMFGKAWKVRQPPTSGNANLLLWPLFTSGDSSHITSETRAWIIRTLEAICSMSGHRQALMLAHVLRDRDGSSAQEKYIQEVDQFTTM
ncbi:hypothetical protein MMC25_002692 [Agyrium rufum]|nr:hypothetical protein [Agyrium rufum]